jgi:lipopolysaccharide transport system permease protein
MDEAVYTAASQLRHPRQFLSDALRSLRASGTLARRLFVRDLRARYRQSVLGLVWIAVPSAAQTAMWLFLSASDIVNSGHISIAYPVYVLVGTLLWQTFSDALSSPGNQLANAAPLLSRVNFPPESVLLAGLADVAANTVVRILIAEPVLLWYGILPGFGWLLVPAGLVILALLGFGIGLVIAPFGLLYEDLGRLMSLVTSFWLLFTPIAYVLPAGGIGHVLLRLNPVSSVLVATRNWMTQGPLVPGAGFAIVSAVAIVLATGGWMLLRVSVPHLIDRFGS